MCGACTHPGLNFKKLAAFAFCLGTATALGGSQRTTPTGYREVVKLTATAELQVYSQHSRPNMGEGSWLLPLSRWR